MKFFDPEEYQPRARTVYLEIARKLGILIPNAVIEHVGSSAIKEVVSKGDLDVFVGVDRTEISRAIMAIEGLGFRIKRDTLRTHELHPFESKDYPFEVGIQLVALGSRFEFFTRFRDILNSSAVLRERYNNLKLNAERLDGESYRQVKSAFIETILKENGSVMVARKDIG